jgi:Ca2+-binding RTX toxin-like protein
MLAAGGLLGLLLVGAAVGGLMSGYGGTDDDREGDHSGDDLDPSEGSGSQDPEQEHGGGLAELLFGSEFGDQVDGADGAGMQGPDIPADEEVTGTDQGEDPFQETTADLADTPPLHQEETQGHDTVPHEGLQEVNDTIPFGTGPDIPFVSGFDVTTDRLILDFDGTKDEAPLIDIDLDSSPGNAVVRANGLAITLVDGATGMTSDHVDVVMSGDAMEPHVDARAALLDGGSVTDLAEARAAIQGHVGDTGQDALTGGPGDDALTGTETGDVVFGNEGSDTLAGAGGNDELRGDEGDDLLDGGEGGDFLDGGGGDDSIDGGDGEDTLLAGAGDTVTGGAGADTFIGGVRSPGSPPAEVTDFDPATDRIEVLYDPARVSDPEIGVIDFGDGTGASITLNGEVMMRVHGAQGLDPANVDLRTLTPQG